MEKTPFFKKTWFIILAFIFLPPLGIILMWISKTHWKAFIKIPISIILAFWSLILCIAIFLPADESSVTESKATAVEEVTTEKAENKTESVLQTTQKESTTKSTSTQAQTTEKETTSEKNTTTKADVTTTKPTATKSTTAPATTRKETTTVKPTTTKPATTKAPTTTKATTTKAPTTAKPTTTKAPTTVDPDSRVTVYITPTGSKYHYENPCGNGTYSPISLADAKALGLTACEKCVLH